MLLISLVLNMLNSHLSMCSICIKKPNLKLQHSLCFSLVLIQLLMLKRLVSQIINLLMLVHLLISQWDKVKKIMQILFCKKQLKKVIGVCSKMYILCKLGWKSLNVSLKLHLKMVLIQNLESLFLLNHQVYQIKKLFLNQFCKTLLKLLMKLHKILNLIFDVPSLNLMNHSSNVLSLTSFLNSKLYYLDSACIIHWLLVAKSSVHKVGHVTTISMTVILQFVVMYSITIWPNMKRFHTLILPIFMEKLCMVVILLMVGTEELTILILLC